jgi:hypothetical protein
VEKIAIDYGRIVSLLGWGKSSTKRNRLEVAGLDRGAPAGAFVSEFDPKEQLPKVFIAWESDHGSPIFRPGNNAEAD